MPTKDGPATDIWNMENRIGENPPKKETKQNVQLEVPRSSWGLSSGVSYMRRSAILPSPRDYAVMASRWRLKKTSTISLGAVGNNSKVDYSCDYSCEENVCLRFSATNIDILGSGVCADWLPQN